MLTWYLSWAIAADMLSEGRNLLPQALESLNTEGEGNWSAAATYFYHGDCSSLFIDLQ